MGTPEISVVMPVYNSSKYLNESIDSILNQSFKNLELIMVDDGSTDNSGQILEQYRRADSRIKLFTQINSGQSIARNVALDVAKGKYIYFMDSDDILSVDALMACYNKAEDNELDLVFFDAAIFYEELMEPFGFGYNRKNVVDTSTVYTGTEVLNLLLDKQLFRAGPWMHFVRKQVIDNQSLRFFPRIIHEDELFIPQLYMFSNRVGYIPKDFFNRRVRSNSTMTKKFARKNIEGYLTVANELDMLKEDKSLQKQSVIDRLIGNIINSVAYQSSQLPLNERLPVISFVIKKGLSGITFKNFLILLFPITIKIKSIFKY